MFILPFTTIGSDYGFVVYALELQFAPQSFEMSTENFTMENVHRQPLENHKNNSGDDNI